MDAEPLPKAAEEVKDGAVAALEKFKETVDSSLRELDDDIARLETRVAHLAAAVHGDAKSEAEEDEGGLWKRYPSLLNEKQLGEALNDNNFREVFDVTEKLDGSNFAAVVKKGVGVTDVYSRNRKLAADDKFHGLQTKIHAYSEIFANYMADHGCEKDVLIFYGEIYGKYFPNAKGKFEPTSSIMSRVAYSPGVEIRFFDVYDPHSRKFHPTTNWAGLPAFVHILYRGTLGQCHAWCASNMDRPTDYSAPGHQGIKQKVEGYVLRPENTFYKGHERIMYKYRNEHFRDDVRGAHRERKQVAAKPPVVNPFEVYVTDAWFANFMSKQANRDEFRARFGEFQAAAMAEIEQDADAPRPVDRKLVGSALMAAFKRSLKT